MCAERKSEEKGFFSKNRARGPSDVRITNEKGWETIPEETGSSRTERSLVFVTRLCAVSFVLFVSILALSLSERVSLCSGRLPFVFRC